MKNVGDQAPDFLLRGVFNGKITTYSLKSFKARWLILFFYPKDFTFICPTEVKGFNDALAEFQKLNCQVAGISVDSVETHQEWIKELGSIRYPLLSDVDRKASAAYGVLDVSENIARRSNFIINAKGM